ncbi:hypothetical protein ACIOMM_35400 [Streptomyces sp. NPDC087908]|uniref:hypothetical protein n=1 Tax=Streptomyces sp. NPDC087908 TaxID=3365820 RepID=UPI0037F243D5
MSSDPQTEQLCRLFTETAHEITPSPVPLDNIERSGRIRKKRRLAMLWASTSAAACFLALHMPLAHTVLPVGDASSPPLTASHSNIGAWTVVAEGERVSVAQDIELWLTKDGKHWSTPTEIRQFRSITDGNVDVNRPSVSVQMEQVHDVYFLSGLFHGKGRPARVTVTTMEGTVTGHIVQLADQPDWGVWYTTMQIPPRQGAAGGFVLRVDVSDVHGIPVASFVRL